MPITSWNSNLSTGHGDIDDDHRLLIDAMNRVYDALMQGDCAPVLHQALTTLQSYVEKHFDREEAWMHHLGYPDVVKHMREHDALRDQVDRLLGLRNHPAEHLGVEMLVVLKNWLIGHIGEADRAICGPSQTPLGT
jgi:hemerythrin-like metal-binding protein